MPRLPLGSRINPFFCFRPFALGFALGAATMASPAIGVLGTAVMLLTLVLLRGRP